MGLIRARGGRPGRRRGTQDPRIRVGDGVSAQDAGTGCTSPVIQARALGVVATLEPDASGGDGAEADGEDDEHDHPLIVGAPPGKPEE
jgi:hypothetical protein